MVLSFQNLSQIFLTVYFNKTFFLVPSYGSPSARYRAAKMHKAHSVCRKPIVSWESQTQEQNILITYLLKNGVHLKQGWAKFFCKETNSKYFRLCKPSDLCDDY